MMGAHVRANSLTSLAGGGMSPKAETGNNDLNRLSLLCVYRYSMRMEKVSGLLMARGMTGREAMEPG